MDIKSYEELVRDFHSEGLSWKAAQRKADDLILEE